MVVAYFSHTQKLSDKVEVPIMRQSVLWVIHTNKCGSL